MLAPNPSTALAWIHSELGVSGEGFPADRPDQHGDLPRLGLIVGEVLARLHSVDPTDAPLLRGWPVLEAAVSSRLRAGAIEPSDMGEPYARYGAGELVDMWHASRPETDDAVLCCGNPQMGQLLIADSKLAGLASAEMAVIADRHLDLAVAHQSVHAELGSEAVYSMYEGYGQDPNIVHLDHYVLASRLLGIWRG